MTYTMPSSLPYLVTSQTSSETKAPTLSYVVNQSPNVQVEVCHMQYTDSKTNKTHVHVVNKMSGILDPVIISKQRYDELIEIEKKYKLSLGEISEDEESSEDDEEEKKEDNK